MKHDREWLDALREVDIPASRVNSIDDLFDDPHLNAVNMFSEIEHPTEGTLKVARFPIEFSKTPAAHPRASRPISVSTPMR